MINSDFKVAIDNFGYIDSTTFGRMNNYFPIIWEGKNKFLDYKYQFTLPSNTIIYFINPFKPHDK